MRSLNDDRPFRGVFTSVLSVYTILAGPAAIVLVSYIFKEYLYDLQLSANGSITRFWFLYSQPAAYHLLLNAAVAVFVVIFLKWVRDMISDPIEILMPPWYKGGNRSDVNPDNEVIKLAGMKAVIFIGIGYILTISFTIRFQFASIGGGYMGSTSIQNSSFGADILTFVSHIPIISNLLVVNEFLKFPSPLAMVIILVPLAMFYVGIWNLAYVFKNEGYIQNNRDNLTKTHYYVKFIQYTIPILLLIALLMTEPPQTPPAL